MTMTTTVRIHIFNEYPINPIKQVRTGAPKNWENCQMFKNTQLEDQVNRNNG